MSCCSMSETTQGEFHSVIFCKKNIQPVAVIEAELIVTCGTCRAQVQIGERCGKCGRYA